MTFRRLILAILLLMTAAFSCAGKGGAPRLDRIHDRVELLEPEDAAALDTQLGLFFRQFGIDAHALFEALPADASLDRAAAERFDDLGVGEPSPQHRGVLFLYDTTSQTLRIEVSYALEGDLPDALVGYLIDEHARYLFDDGNPAQAFSLGLRLLTDHFRTAQLGGEFDPTGIEMLRAWRFRAGGAGASGEAPLGTQSLIAFPVADRGDDGLLRPGASVAATYRSFLAWLALGHFDADAKIFTPETRTFLAGWPMTPAYLDRIFVVEYRQGFEVIERGDRAILFSTSNPFNAPYLFRRSAEGWQIDLIAGWDNLMGIAGGSYSWGFRDATSSFLAPFEDRLVLIDGLLRVRGGDNRAGVPFSG